MEFTNGRGDGFSYMTEAEKNDQEASKHPPLFRLSSSSLSPPTAAADNNFLTEKEHMFDKVVTPSDVGKLNRLVIPKQHAEKYFPLDTTANDKGLLLSFEDRTGKSWRFRYSYWNSSQSYVMTKGWSRFVKEKRLDAGDVVSFGRGVGESERDRFYIDWKRRLENHGLPKLWGGRFYNSLAAEYGHRRPGFRYNATNGGDTGGGDKYLFLSSSVAGPPEIGVQHGGGSGSTRPLILNLQPLVRNQAAAKRVRLFGVNLECPKSESNDRTPRGLSASAPQLQSSCSKLLSFLPHESMQSWVASSSSIKEQNLTLDLGI